MPKFLITTVTSWRSTSVYEAKDAKTCLSIPMGHDERIVNVTRIRKPQNKRKVK